MEATREKQTTTIRRGGRRALLILIDLALFSTMLIGLGALNRLHDFGARGHWIKYVLDIVSSWSNSLGFGQLGFIGVTALIAVSAWLCFTLAHYLFAEESFTNTLPWRQNEVNTLAIPNIAAEVLPMVPYYRSIPRDTSGLVFRSVQWAFNPAAWMVTVSNWARLEILSVINAGVRYLHMQGDAAGRWLRMGISGIISLILLLPLRGLQELINAPSNMLRYFYSCLPSRRRSQEANHYTRLYNPPLAIVDQDATPDSYGATDNQSHAQPDFELQLGDPSMPQSLWLRKNGQLQSHPPSQKISTDVKYEQTHTDKPEIIEVTMRGEDGTEYYGRYKRIQSSPALSYMSQQHRQNMEEQRLQEASKQIAEAARKEQERREQDRLDQGQKNLDETARSDRFATHAQSVEAHAQSVEAHAQSVEAHAQSAIAHAQSAAAHAQAAEAKADEVAAAQATMQTQLQPLLQLLANNPLLMQQLGNNSLPIPAPASPLAAPTAAFFPPAGNDGGGAAAEVGLVAQPPTPEPFS